MDQVDGGNDTGADHKCSTNGRTNTCNGRPPRKVFLDTYRRGGLSYEVPGVLGRGCGGGAKVEVAVDVVREEVVGLREHRNGYKRRCLLCHDHQHHHLQTHRCHFKRELCQQFTFIMKSNVKVHNIHRQFYSSSHRPL